jgi:hypothetical protein
METNNILRELSEIIDNTNENIKYGIGLRHADPTRLLEAISDTLTNVVNILKIEADRQANERLEIIKKFNIEKSCKDQAYFFILEKGHINEFREYCARNPRIDFE